MKSINLGRSHGVEVLLAYLHLTIEYQRKSTALEAERIECDAAEVESVGQESEVTSFCRDTGATVRAIANAVKAKGGRALE